MHIITRQAMDTDKDLRVQTPPCLLVRKETCQALLTLTCLLKL